MVTVSGCRKDDESTISIVSKLVPSGLVDLSLKKGTTSIIRHSIHETLMRNERPSYDTDDELSPDDDFNIPKFSGPLPEFVFMKLALWYDNSLLRRFSGDHTATKLWLSRVIEFAKPRMTDPSLLVKIKFVVEIGRAHV